MLHILERHVITNIADRQKGDIYMEDKVVIVGLWGFLVGACLTLFIVWRHL